MMIKTGYQHLADFLRSELSDLKSIFFLVSLYGLLSITSPLAVQSLVNFIGVGGSTQPMIIIALIFFLLIALKGIFLIFEKIIVEYMQRRIFIKNAYDSVDTLVNLDQEEAKKINLTERVNRFFDVIVIQKSVVTLLSIGMLTLFQGLVGSIALIIYSPYFLFVVISLILFFYVVIKIIGRNGYSTAVEVSKIKYEFVNWLSQIANNWDFINRLSTKSYLVEKTNSIINKFLTKREQHFKILLHQNIFTYIFYTLISSSMILLGGFLVINGNINLGQFVAAEVIFFSAISSLIRFVNQLDSYYELTAAFDKVAQLTQLKQEVHSKNKFFLSDIQQISFSSIHTDDQLLLFLQKLSNQVFKKNEPIVLFCESDFQRDLIGQTFIAKNKSLNPFYKIDSNFYKTLDHQAFLSKTQLIKKTIIFEDTLLNNIKIAQDNLELSELQKLFDHFDFYETSTEQVSLDLVLNPTHLSIDHLQLIKLQFIRALLANPELLIVDSYLDNLTPEIAMYLIRKVLSFKKQIIFIVITGDKNIAKLIPKRLKF